MTAPLGLCFFDTPIGACGIAWSESALVAVQLPEETPQRARARMHSRFPGLVECEAPEWVQVAASRVRALLEGAPDSLLDLPLDMEGVPPFHQRVYEVARAIAPGATLTYGEVAKLVGEPGAARAVGQALGHNPFAPVVPCHRVLAAGIRSGGFSASGGTHTKLRMLEIEGAQFGDSPGLF